MAFSKDSLIKLNTEYISELIQLGYVMEDNKNIIISIWETKYVNKQKTKKITGWNLFQKEKRSFIRSQLQSENKDASMISVNKVLSAMWRDEDVKKEYNEKAKESNSSIENKEDEVEKPSEARATSLKTKRGRKKKSVEEPVNEDSENKED